jgi:DNA-binding GntR family transcriptional regulator
VPDRVSVTRSVLAEQVKERLLADILSGAYPPNSRIIETELARELGTSQAPVREALRGLEALGVVELTPFRGARVRRLDRGELIDAYVVRSEIESLGARLAVPRMSDRDIKELSGLVDQMHAAARAHDGPEVAAADTAFHGLIMGLSGNATLTRVWRSLEPLCRTYITLVVPGADPAWTASLHDPILEALRRREKRAVVRALRSHFDQASVMLASRLGDGDTGPDSEPGAPSRATSGSAGPVRADRKREMRVRPSR